MSSRVATEGINLIRASIGQRSKLLYHLLSKMIEYSQGYNLSENFQSKSRDDAIFIKWLLTSSSWPRKNSNNAAQTRNHKSLKGAWKGNHAFDYSERFVTDGHLAVNGTVLHADFTRYGYVHACSSELAASVERDSRKGKAIIKVYLARKQHITVPRPTSTCVPLRPSAGTSLLSTVII